MDQNAGHDAGIKSWAKGINAITLFVEDMDTTRQFYQSVFDLPVIFSDKDSTVIKFGDTLINLLKVNAADELVHPARIGKVEDGARFVFTINVENVDALCAELAEHGVKLLNGPMDRPWGPRTASFMDPGGYIWEIAH